MLDSSGLTQVGVEEVSGFLSDHYDPSKKVLRLSQQVFRSNSLAAAGIAAHEAGHALQDSIGYVPLKFRSAMVPSVQVGSWLGPIIFMVGLMIAGSVGGTIAWVGLFLFAATAIFALVTLPVEFDASRRARAFLTESGVIYQEEINGVRSVLDGAALTYVAAAIQAISTIMYYAYLLMGRRRD
jgi:Zn-dependent membrane protease YugP